MADKKKTPAKKTPAKTNAKKAPAKKAAPAKKVSPAAQKRAQQQMQAQIKELLKLTVFGNPVDSVNTAPKPVRTLAEAKDRPAVFSFGRMNPPTAGHEKLVDKVKETAMKEGGKPYVYLSHTNDRKKNPLSYNDKYRLARRAFGSVMTYSNQKTVINIVKELNKKHDRLVMVVGQDRIKEFQDMLIKYNGIEYDFADIKVLSAGDRDPDADDVSGMSASKMRDFAAGSNLNMFTKGLPSSLQGSAKNIMRDVRKGMDLKHDLSEDITMRRTVGGGAMDASRQTTKRNAKNQRTADADQRVSKVQSAPDDEKLAQGKALGRVMMDVAKERGVPHEDAPKENMAAEGPAFQRAMGKFDTYLDQERRAIKSKGTQRRTAIKEAANRATTNLKIRDTKAGGTGLDDAAIKGMEQQAASLYSSAKPSDRAKAQRLSTQIRQHQRAQVMNRVVDEEQETEQLDEFVPLLLGAGALLSIPATVIWNDLSSDEVLIEIIENHPNNRKMHERIYDAMEEFAKENDDTIKMVILFAAAGLSIAGIHFLVRRGLRWMQRMLMSPSMWRAGTKEAMRNTGLNEEGKGPAQDKYHKGMSDSTKAKRIAHFKAGKEGDAPGDKKARKEGMPESEHTKKFKQMFGESVRLHENKTLKDKASKADAPYGVVKNVYEKGVAAWKTGGHRPGTTPEQWGYARVNSFLTGGKTQKTADKKEWKEVLKWREEQKKKKKTVKEEKTSELIKKSQEKRGAKGTLKAKIDGPITKEKVMALKNADDATTLDKKQANFWLNMNEDVIMEAEYQGKKVKLNDPIRNSGGKKKFRVYTTDPKTGNVIKVQFGDPGMSIKRDSDERRKAFRSRHGCDALTFEDDRDTPKYWSCRMWEKGKSVSELD